MDTVQSSLRQSLWDRIGDASHSVFSLLSMTDMLAVSMVDKALHAEVAPYLFKEVKLRFRGHPLCEKPDPVVQCLNTILQRPHLGSHVHRLLLLGRNHYQKGDAVQAVHAKYLDLGKAQEAIESLGQVVNHFSEQWLEQLRCGTMDACVTLLLTQLPNLQYLKMELDFTKQTSIMGLYLRLLLPDQRPPLLALGRLREVDHSAWHPDFFRILDGRNTPDVLPFFHLPTLRRLTVALDNPVDFAWPLPQPPDISNIATLHLSIIREAHLHHILALATNLKDFTWTWYYDPESEHKTNTANIDLEVFISALSHVHDNLECLTVIADAFCGSDYYRRPAFAIIGTLNKLSEFPCLQHLNLPMALLMGGWSPSTATTSIGSVLPSQLSKLTINHRLHPHEMNFEEDPLGEWDPDNIPPAIQAWLVSHPREKPRLDHLVILRDWWYTGPVKPLLNLGRAFGIRISLVERTGIDGQEVRRLWNSWQSYPELDCQSEDED